MTEARLLPPVQNQAEQAQAHQRVVDRRVDVAGAHVLDVEIAHFLDFLFHPFGFPVFAAIGLDLADALEGLRQQRRHVGDGLLRAARKLAQALAQFDLGAILRRESGGDTPRIMRFLVGNPLIMKEMVKHVPDAGSYAPVTILIDERRDGVHVSYDKMESALHRYGNPEALAVARNLDTKITTLLRDCTG